MKVRLPNSGGAGNMNQMLKQAQKMQADMANRRLTLSSVNIPQPRAAV